jgi:hypothetical protein
MMTTQRDSSNTRHRPRPRRGNTIVLVSAVLVLLVITAAAFLTRSQAGRTTSRAINDAEQRGAKVRTIAEALANEAALALFPRPVDVAYGVGVTDSNAPRLTPPIDAVRYGIDQDRYVNATQAVGSDGFPDFPANFAPYWVVPWTNWPDDALPISAWPQGPGAPGGQTMVGGVVMGERNPVGNPGFGDARWLADAEPQRWATGALASFGLGHYLDAYSHWRHLSNISRPNNGFRIVTDIADVFDFGPDGVPDSGDEDGLGQLLTNLNVPVEQWLTIPPGSGALLNTYTGDTQLPGDIETRFGNWFFNYPGVYANSNVAPPNFLKLNDLDADGVILEPGERPEDEFIAGTARWAISRFMTDTDGDGYTDSFWFAGPTPVEKGIRQLVAMRIVDNGAMANANASSRFDRLATIGATPADTALVGQNVTFPFSGAVANWNTGLFDTPANDEAYRVVPLGPPYVLFGNATQRWTPARWEDVLLELGITAGSGFFIADNASDVEVLRAQVNRLAYWQFAGRRPLNAALQLTPFNLSDELELRMYHGQNYPWILSRFEQAVNSLNQGASLLRSQLDREETSEYLDQLRNRELLYDLRSKLTLFNGARNEEMPPWLWWRWTLPTFVNTQVERENFLRQARRKLDLREAPDPLLETGELSLRERLAPTIMLALTDGNEGEGQSYFGAYPPAGSPGIVPAVPDADGILQRNRRLAAGLAANILAARDEDQRALLADDPSTLTEEGVVLVPKLGQYPTMEPDSKPVAFMGMEAQPFLLEAFIGHVYKGYDVPIVPPPLNFSNQGATVVFDNDDYRSTIAVVQILYSIDGSFESGEVKTKWLDFLDLLPADHVARTCLVDVNAGMYVCDGTTGAFPTLAGWSTDRDDYDDSDDPAIVLRRADPIDGTPVVIDRIEPPVGEERDFGDAVNDLVNDKPEEVADPALVVPEAGGGTPFPGHQIADAGVEGNWWWASWVRTTRAWAVDLNNDGLYGKTERNPRYVYGGDLGRTVVLPADTPVIGGGAESSFVFGGNKYDFDLVPDADGGAGVPWFQRGYLSAAGLQVVRKPTFFDMNRAGTIADYPDKGWYQQGADTDADGAADGIVGVDDTFDSFYTPYSLQMLRKDGDFLQVGELLNVWTFGHELRMIETSPDVFGLDAGDDDGGTISTFSEFMTDEGHAGEGPRVNRLQLARWNFGGDELGATVGRFDEGLNSVLNQQRQALPSMPAGLRVLDAFVCDGPGIAAVTDFNQDGSVNDADIEARRFYNAQAFDGLATPGLVNIGTAPLEVLRTLPHMYRMIHAFEPPQVNPRIAVAEAMIQFRERFDGSVTGVPQGPDYNDPADESWSERLPRGFASTAEILRLTEPGQAQLNETTGLVVTEGAWQVTAGAQQPFGDPDDAGLDVILATDVTPVVEQATGDVVPDRVAGDAEEAALLYAGLSNLVTTRSDVFTIYFRVRSFRQSELTGRWDALERESIVDDSRYVMLVDRSAVNRSSDRPRILYLEKLPN